MLTACREAKKTPWPHYPLLRSWASDNPLPTRILRGPLRPKTFGLNPVPWLSTGPADHPFDFCGHVERLARDIVARCPSLRHVDVSRLQFAVTAARNGRRHGLQARVTPLRLRDGRLTRRRRNLVFQIQRYYVDGREILYLVTFCLPRFLDLSFDDKFITLFHEFYHISPAFNGDLRRHEGRYSVHSHNQKEYDRHMSALAREYLAGNPDPALHAFLRLDFSQLVERHGGVKGFVIPRPKVIPLPPGQTEVLVQDTERPAARK